MQKFTIFSVLLTVVIIVIVAEIMVNDYLPQFEKPDIENELALLTSDPLGITEATQVNVLGADLQTEIDTNTGTDLSLTTETVDTAVDLNSSSLDLNNSSLNSDITDFESNDYSGFDPNVYIREDQIKSAGFSSAYLADDSHNGYLFKTIYIDDLHDVNFKKYLVRDNIKSFAKIYVFTTGPSSQIDQLYEVLKARAAEGLQTEINETNEFGNKSFYLNDKSRPSTAFLTVKVGSLLYAFSYPKEYHPQIRNLIQLIDLEF